MSRTLLYYPTFELPSEQWLKDALLYWDEVSSIVPERFRRVIETPNLQFLSDEGIYRPLDPEPFLQSYDTQDDFTNEFIRRLESPEFLSELNRPDSGQYWHIAFEKMTYSAWSALVDKNLTLDKSNWSDWVRVRKPAAILYMGLLARFLAAHNSAYVQPSTNYAEYEDVIYRCVPGKQPLNGAALTLKNLLPQVASDTSLLKLVDFRNTRREELLRLRQVVDEHQAKIAKSETDEEAKLILTQFEERLELALGTINRLMNEQGIRYTVGTMRAIFALKAPTLLGGAVGLTAGSMLHSPAIELFTTIAGYVAGGAIELAQYTLDAKDKRRTLLESPFSYLYSARQEGVV